jgi:hypothetical protein
MKGIRLLVFILLIPLFLTAQKTLLLEKIGTNRKFYYHAGDKIELRTLQKDSLFKVHLWDITDSTVTLLSMRPYTIPLRDIKYVYKEFRFPRKLAVNLAIFGGLMVGIISVNHLINNESLANKDVLIVPAICFGGSIISFSLSKQRFRIGTRWKFKVLDMPVVGH